MNNNQNQSPESNNSKYQLGKAFSMADNHKEAIRCFIQALELEPHNAEIHFCLASEYFKTKDYLNTYLSLINTLNITPNHENALLSLGLLIKDWGKHYDLANDCFKRVLLINENNLKAQESLRDCNLSSKFEEFSFEDIENEFDSDITDMLLSSSHIPEKYLKINSNLMILLLHTSRVFKQAYNLIIEYKDSSIAELLKPFQVLRFGKAWLTIRNFLNSINTLITTVKYKPSNHYGQRQVLNAIFSNGNYQKICAQLIINLQENPITSETYNNIGISFFQLHLVNDAQKCFQHAISVDPNNDLSYLLLGLIEYTKNNHQKALAYYKNAFEINPNNQFNYLYTAAALNSIGLHDVAVQLLNRAIEINPNISEFFIQLGRTLKLLKDISRLEELKFNFKSKSSDLIEANVSLTYFFQGSTQKAFEILIHVFKVNPNFELDLLKSIKEIRTNLCLALISVRRLDEAVNLLGLSNKKGYKPNLYLVKGIALSFLDKHDEAINCYIKAKELNPKFALLELNMGYATVVESEVKMIEIEKMKIINILPQDASEYDNFGIAFSQLGDSSSLLKYYMEAIQSNPNPIYFMIVANFLSIPGLIAESNEILYRVKKVLIEDNNFNEIFESSMKSVESVDQSLANLSSDLSNFSSKLYANQMNRLPEFKDKDNALLNPSHNTSSLENEIDANSLSDEYSIGQYQSKRFLESVFQKHVEISQNIKSLIKQIKDFSDSQKRQMISFDDSTSRYYKKLKVHSELFNSLNTRQECELCYGIIEQAVVLLPCQHRKTCIQCAQLVMQDNRRCPFDRIKIDCLMIINN